jgi:DNA helicase-2/ATP-dependent DNA helicase PcrA
MQHLHELNERQKEAVLKTEGPLLIIAGAGAGKTKTLTHRIVHLVLGGVRPENILAITFTNKAAHEMRERALSLLEKYAGRTEGVPFISTFHSLGVHILKAHAVHYGLTRHFGIADENDSMALIKESIEAAGLDVKQTDPRKVRGLISRIKGEGMSAEGYYNKTSTHYEKMVAEIFRNYERFLKRDQAFDFDDLLLKSVELLRKYPEIRNEYRARFRYIHVDEYQDTNGVQYELTKLLVGDEKNLCVVGDGDQNIYSWRGANLKNILNFERDYTGAHVVLLEENYRSTKNILEAANAVIKKNTVRKDKNLFTQNNDGPLITLVECYDESVEANHLAEEIAELERSGVAPESIAILYRANFQSRILEEALLRAQVPYQVLGTKFFDRKEIKDILSYIRAALNKESLGDIKRIINIPARGIGKVTLVKLLAGERAQLPLAMQKKIEGFYSLLDSIHIYIQDHLPSEVVKFIIKETGLEEQLSKGSSDDLERLENMRELVTVALSYDTFGVNEGLERLLENAALASDQDTLLQKKEGGVRLMTVHASKGLEFDYIFITGLEQDLFPHRRDSKRTIEDQEEERRLFYVALTRAAKKLTLSYASVRTLYGQRMINAPSEFIFDIPEHLIERTVAQNTPSYGHTIFLE